MTLDLAARVRESRASQGLPPTVQDPATVAKVASILASVPARTAHQERAAA